MIEIQKENTIFHVDLEKTREYYKIHSLCDCCYCQNLSTQIKEAFPKLDAFLSTFGVDITSPDEAAPVEMADTIDYLFVGYTVTGTMEASTPHTIELDHLNITISQGNDPHEWFPNEQKEPCFFILVSGISLPWMMGEPFPKRESFKDKIKKGFKKHRDA